MKSHFMLARSAAMACAVTGAASLLPGVSPAQTFVAADYATNAAYADGWQTNDNGGFGFTAWGMNGTYTSAIQHGLTNSACPFNQIGMAWTIYNPNARAQGVANPPDTGTAGGDISRAGRGFPPLQIGQTISTVFDNPTQQSFFRGYTVKLVSGGENTIYGEPLAKTRLAIGTFEYFTYGRWYGMGENSSLFDTDTAGGTRLDVTLTGPGTNQFKMVVTPFSNPSLAITNIGTFENSGNIDWIQFELYNTDSDFFPNAVDGGQSTDFYVRSITITDVQAIPPEIIKQPRSKILYAGRTARFEVEPLGNFLSYQWRKDGVNLSNGGNISGAQANQLVINNISAADFASYTVVITNVAGAVTSSPPATLTLAPAPVTPYEVAVVSANPVGHWRFSETNDPAPGTALAQDYVGGYAGLYGTACSNKFNGTLGPLPADGFSMFETGNGAMQSTANTAESWVTAPPLNLNTDTATFTGWIYPMGPQSDFCGLIYSRLNGVGAGLTYGGDSLGSGGQLAYAWNNNSSATWSYISGLGIPDGQWSFVALAVEPSQAVLYLYNANGQISATNAIAHTAESLPGEFTFGADPNNSVGRTFNGKIDEVAIFNRALTAAELLNLYNGVGTPQVTISIHSAGPNVVLTWPQGTLLESPSVTGPWTTNLATSPFTNSPTSNSKFYRVRVQ